MHTNLHTHTDTHTDPLSRLSSDSSLDSQSLSPPPPPGRVKPPSSLLLLFDKQLILLAALHWRPPRTTRNTMPALQSPLILSSIRPTPGPRTTPLPLAVSNISHTNNPHQQHQHQQLQRTPPAPPSPSLSLQHKPHPMSRPYEPHRAHSDPPFKRRGRQATACTECNRRKQKVGWAWLSVAALTYAQCNGLRPCHHCSRRNLGNECRFPDSRAPKTPGTWGPGGKHPRSDDDDDLDDEDSEADAGSGGGAHSSRGSGHSHTGSTSSISEGIHAISPGSHHASHAGSSGAGAGAGGPGIATTPRNRANLHHPSPLEPFPFRRPQPSAGHPFALPLSFDRTDPEERGVKWSKDPPGPSGTHQERDTLAKQPQSGTAKHDHTLMQEGGAPGIGSLAIEGSGVERKCACRARSRPGQFQFYGTSHFGPRLAAQVMNVSGVLS